MTKQMKAAMAAMLMVGTLPMQAQEPLSTTTKTVKVAPGETKTTVITKEAGAGTATGATGSKHRKRRRKAAHATVARESETSREIRELTEKQAAQQAQIDQLTQANAAANAQLAAAQTAAAGAEAQAQTATQQAQSVNATVQANTDAVQQLKTNVTDLQTTNAGLASTISANKVELNDKIESPTVIHYKGIKITPVAFFAAEGVWRQRAVNSDINTPFNSIPFMGSNEAHVSEFNFSGRQSRLGGLFEGDAGPFKLSGYFESDFLGAGTTSNNNQSNSYLFRVRQIWGKAENKSGTAITAGQTWSLATENQKSTDVRTEKLPNTIDPQYVVGYSWGRVPGVRIQQKIGNPFLGAAATIAVSAENAQIVNFTASAAPANFFFAGPGQTGGLYNSTGNGVGAQNYTDNLSPDVVAKIALDFPHAHVEVGGLARFFRDRVYPGIAGVGDANAAIVGAAPYNSTTYGGGGFASFRVTSKRIDFGMSGMVGDGTGRYGSAQLADLTVRPNGTLEPIRNAHGLISIETHPAPKLDIFAYYGGEYAQRTVYLTTTTTTSATTGLTTVTTNQTGYGPNNLSDAGCFTQNVAPTTLTTNGAGGALGSCASPTRYIQEGVIGFTYRAASSPKYGRLQYQATYSYLTKSTWTGITDVPAAATATTPAVLATFGSPKAVENMIHVGMRYYIP